MWLLGSETLAAVDSGHGAPAVQEMKKSEGDNEDCTEMVGGGVFRKGFDIRSVRGVKLGMRSFPRKKVSALFRMHSDRVTEHSG